MRPRRRSAPDPAPRPAAASGKPHVASDLGAQDRVRERRTTRSTSVRLLMHTGIGTRTRRNQRRLRGRRTRRSTLAIRTRILIGNDSSPETLVTAGRACRIQPAAVDLGTPSRVPMEMSPVSCTSWTRRWSYARCGRFELMTRGSGRRREKGRRRASPGVPSVSVIRRKCSDSRDSQLRDCAGSRSTPKRNRSEPERSAVAGGRRKSRVGREMVRGARRRREADFNPGAALWASRVSRWQAKCNRLRTPLESGVGG